MANEVSFTGIDVAAAVAVAVVFALIVSLAREPARQRLMAILVAGAGAAYLNGGLGVAELPFVAAATWVAYRGLASYRFIGVAWLMHAGWDVVHHLYGHPILSFAPTSSGQCAVCDTLIAIWFLAGAPSVYRLARRREARAA
jgi:hypothetical protein